MVLDAREEVKQRKFAQFACENKKLVDKMCINFNKLRKFSRLNTLYNYVGPIWQNKKTKAL